MRCGKFFGAMWTVLAMGCGADSLRQVPASATIVVVDKADGAVSFIDAASLTKTGTASAGYLAHEIASTPDGQFAYVTNYGSEYVTSKSPANKPGNTLSVIDLRLKKEVAQIVLGQPPCEPHGVVTSANGQRIYVTCEARQEIVVVDRQKREVSHAIATRQQYSHMLVVTPDETRAYVTNFGPGTVTVLDLGKREIIKQIRVGEGAEGIALAPDGKSVYVTATKDNRLSRIDTDSLTVVAQVATDATPIRVEPTPDGKRVVVNNAGAGTLQVFDAATLAEVKRIKTGQLPIGLSVPSNERAYVARMNDQKISVVDLQRLEVVGEVQTGRLPDGLVYVPTVK